MQHVWASAPALSALGPIGGGPGHEAVSGLHRTENRPQAVPVIKQERKKRAGR